MGTFLRHSVHCCYILLDITVKMTKYNANLTMQSNLIRFSKFWHSPHLKCTPALSMDIEISNCVHIIHAFKRICLLQEWNVSYISLHMQQLVWVRCTIANSFQLLASVRSLPQQRLKVLVKRRIVSIKGGIIDSRFQVLLQLLRKMCLTSVG